MTDMFLTAAGMILPFLGTTLGAAAVFVIMRQMSVSWKSAMLGFAAGVMIAASVWSLLIPAIEMTENAGGRPWLPATVGFLAGILILPIADRIMTARPSRRKEREDEASGREKMLFWAVTLHNIPEGMAVGVVFAGALAGGVPMFEAFALSVGIAVQNFPEGAIISVPLGAEGMKKSRAFLYGVASGAVEPMAALITMALTAVITPVLPYILSFAAGAMIYVVIDELVPSAKEGGSAAGTVGAALGFALMMLLDIAFR